MASKQVSTGLENEPVGTLGTFSMFFPTGTMAAGLAANSEILQFRWTSATVKAVVQAIGVGAGGITAFTAGFTQFDVMQAHTWTAAGTGGGTATITSPNGKLATTMPVATSVAEIRIATTAALGAGTKTLFAHSCAGATGSTTATAGTPLLPPTVIYDAMTSREHPIVLAAANEGFVVRATAPATGTWTGGIWIKWIEMAV